MAAKFRRTHALSAALALALVPVPKAVARHRVPEDFEIGEEA
jgi:hypothetical protein